MKIKMRISLLMLIIISSVALSGIILAFIVSEQYAQTTLERAVTVNANFIETQAKTHLQAKDFEPNNFEEKRQIFTTFFKGIDTSEIVRIKVWATDGTIVYSDKSDIIGQNFADNAPFQKSLSGQTASVIKEPVKPENVQETGYGQLIEIYVPIISESGQVIGTIETYTSLDFVNQSIGETTQMIFLVVIISSLAIMSTILFVFINLRKNILTPIISIQDATKKIASGDFAVNLKIEGDDELKDLSDDVNVMAKELAKQRNALVHSERLSAIGQLAARLAHDLRNPLNVIKHTVNMLRKKLESSMDESDKTHCTRLNRSIRRIAHQIDEVMDFVRIRQPEINEHSIMTIAKNALEPLIIPESVKFILPSNDSKVLCDPRQMEVVLANLFSNSIDAIQGGGTVTLKISENVDKTIIEVQDSGMGIPQDKLETVFEPLYTTKQTGTGLGLASCREIIRQHGGTITVTNNPTTFRITLPKVSHSNKKAELMPEVK